MNFLSFLEVLLIAKGQKQAMNSWKKADLVRWESLTERLGKLCKANVKKCKLR